MRARLLTSAGTGLAVITSLLLAAPAQGTLKPHPSPSHAGTANDPEFSALQKLAGDIEVLGDSKYPTTFAGDMINAGALYVYIVPGDSQPFLDAVAALDTGGLPYSVQGATQSYATQAATSKWLQKNWTAFRKDGVSLEVWAPSPAHDAVLIQLATPANSQMAALKGLVAKVQGGQRAKRPLQLPNGEPVTSATYPGVVQALLNAMSPAPGATFVSPSYLGVPHVLDGLADYKPFDGADRIWYELTNLDACTGNFGVVNASNTSVQYLMTAGHCNGGNAPVTGHDFYTCYTTNSSGKCNYNVGTVNRTYWSADDYELIPSSVVGYVWNNSTSTEWSVNGSITPATGDYLTVDGSFGKAVYDNYVAAGWSVGTCFTETLENGSSHLVCNGFEVEKTTPNCKSGDSGGPVLQRESDGYHIHAAGMIQAGTSGGGWYYCLGQAFYAIQSEANLKLILGS